MRHTLLLLAITTATTAMGQPPNDQCSGITPFNLPVGTTEVRTGTRTGATTLNDGVPTSILMNTPNVATVWEAFTTTTCSNVTALFCNTPLPATTMWTFLATTCPADTQIPFSFANFGIFCTNGQFGISWHNLPPGTYYLPIYCTTAGGAYTVEITAAACNPGPANDDCTGATPLTVHTTCTPTAGSVENGTFSFPAQTCNGATGDPNDDVWFSFVATGADHTITMDADGNGLDAVIELYGGDCTAPTFIACADATLNGGTETLVANGLSQGETYWFRVFHYYTPLATDPGFTVCVVGDVGTAVEDRDDRVLTISPALTDGPVAVTGGPAGGVLRVLDRMGRTVRTDRIAAERHVLDLAPLPAGSYVIEVRTADGVAERATVVRY
ncbi:MAG: hypothetical protein IT228_08135 [Flavobacteriales bacterium]|nr:hypothetical protein [Flavobacteriales bacterium]MCC6577296.1 hypothetical protein [Flavobacteriales bacterium]NUQ13737.1 hypothetical protein [Flavobacteriales bacterium]